MLLQCGPLQHLPKQKRRLTPQPRVSIHIQFRFTYFHALPCRALSLLALLNLQRIKRAPKAKTKSVFPLRRYEELNRGDTRQKAINLSTKEGGIGT